MHYAHHCPVRRPEMSAIPHRPYQPRRIRMAALAAAAATAAAMVLAGCAQLQPVQTADKLIGSPESAVRQTFGEPTDTFQLADGTTRWIYSKQPYGYDIYAADFDANGRLKNFREMLTEAEIYKAQPGVWTKKDVLERWGRPREPINYYPLMKREAWSYRMYVSPYQPAHFSVYFTDAGVVDRTMIILDARGDRNRR
ncbi:Beta-barrel assembly machine subunit BamE [Cupriavidus plantarum]|uniref:Beta-barrel assembly machine subunit BamE n=2 Tax=Cupriavidus plantarum TaxID=942865 RepID=A0A316FCR4_9BURK|nr:hypothetical protein C7419_102446 [Cupriavidus plantarum]REE93615.1 hypothetical protein C7418_2383 [Cupriavidus plantarum]RLK39036.1 hypothetical protein C7417_2566 [Cupriavidus plantarum]CAG2135756.1 hypothetical protein LMG26296_02252 [Cupriavidus plantarum]SMR84634.1 hypothetical protein SAMN05421735_3424 [Cupriavidus plantarum]